MHRATVVAVLIAVVLIPTALFASDWPRFRGPNGDGISPEKGINKSWAQKPPKMLWKVPMSDDGFAGPSVAAGKVFIVDHKDTQDIVRAIDLKTGENIWQYTYENADKNNHGFSRATPTVDHGRVYTLSYPGLINCLDVKTGKKLWSRDICSDFKGKKPNWGYSMSVLVDGNKVIACPGGPDAAVAALDKTTGRIIWQGGGTRELGYATPEVAIIGGKRQYVVFTATDLMGLDTATGAVLWSYTWSDRPIVHAAQPIAIGDAFFVTSGYSRGCALIEVSGGAARSKWESKDMQAHFSSPVLIGGLIYGNSDPGNLVCLDPQTGEVKWKQPGFEKGPVMAVDGVLLAMEGNIGNLVMINPTPQKYDEMGRFKPLGGQSWTPPIISNGKLIVRNKTGLACFDLK